MLFIQQIFIFCLFFFYLSPENETGTDISGNELDWCSWEDVIHSYNEHWNLSHFFAVQYSNCISPDFFTCLHNYAFFFFLTLQIMASVVLDCQEIPQVHPVYRSSCYARGIWCFTPYSKRFKRALFSSYDPFLCLEELKLLSVKSGVRGDLVFPGLAKNKLWGKECCFFFFS